MYRRIALATAACALAIPASTLASEPAATGAGGVGVQPASGLKVTSVKASKSGRTVTAKVRWDRALIVSKAQRERFTVRLLAGPAGARRLLGTVSRRAPRGTSETVLFRLNARNARRVKSSSRVFVTATQQFDSPDTDRLYELNHVSIAPVKGKRPFASAAASSCPTVIKPDTDMTGCQLPGSNLSGADLSGVNFTRANLELSNLAGARLLTTTLTQADLTGASLAGATMRPAEQAALTFPGQGDQIGDLIDSAKTSVDVIIYDIAGPNIVGQPGSPGALMKAIQRGVNVRVVINSGNKGCDSLKDADQAKCLGGPAVDRYYAVENALKWARQNPNRGVATPGNYRVQFSSQNYQITHQKTIFIDTSDRQGNPLTASQMGPETNSKILVSTGNLASLGWGSYQYYDSTNKRWVILNKDYLNTPAKTCTDSARKPIPCSDEWSARDFAIKVTDPNLMERLAAVFAADQACKSWAQAPIYQQLLGSTLPDTWANGTLLAGNPPASYPEMGSESFYNGFGPNPDLQADPARPGHVLPQGNSRQRQLDLIASAKQSLIVYNEEMDDPDMINALVAAERRGVSVRVVMSSSFYNGKPSPKNEVTFKTKAGLQPGNYKFSYLVSNGVSVRFFNSNSDSTALYIHAKAIVADGLNAFMGSENFGYASMNYNRELGLMLTNDTDNESSQVALSVGGVAAIMTAFSKDWNSQDAVPFAAQKPLDQPFPGYPQADYPQPKPGYNFTDPDSPTGYEFNIACLPPSAGNFYEPKLPARTIPSSAPAS